jgi:hypothetical protein
LTEATREDYRVKLRRVGDVLWVFGTHTFYVIVVILLLKFVEILLLFVGMSNRHIPIPFFPAAVPLDDAFLLFDFVTIVLLYLIAFKEVAELHGIWRPQGGIFWSIIQAVRGGRDR